MASSTLVFGALAIVIAAVVLLTSILRDMLPKQMERNAKLDELDSKIYVLHSESQDLQDRVNSLQQTRDHQSAERYRLEGDIRKMHKAVNDLAHQPPLFVHEVGDAQNGMAKFVAELKQEAASNRQQRSGGERVSVNPIWRYPNVAEVWANTPEEARQVLDVAYPTKLGFSKSFTLHPSEAERLVDQMTRKGKASSA